MASGDPSGRQESTSRKQALEPAVFVGTVRELSDALESFAKSERPVAEIRLTRDLDLTREQAADGESARGLIVHNKDGKLTIAAAAGPEKKASPGARDVSQLRTIRIAYDSNLSDAGEGFPFLAALAIKGGDVTLRNIRFELRCSRRPAHRHVGGASPRGGTAEVGEL